MLRTASRGFSVVELGTLIAMVASVSRFLRQMGSDENVSVPSEIRP
jgi:hypothetical protein